MRQLGDPAHSDFVLEVEFLSYRTGAGRLVAKVVGIIAVRIYRLVALDVQGAFGIQFDDLATVPPPFLQTAETMLAVGGRIHQSVAYLEFHLTTPFKIW
jgi:hypothetical protein